MNSKLLFVFLITVWANTTAQRREGDSCVDNYTNTVGKCKPAESCDSARNDYQVNGIRPTFCTYNAFGVTLVCCRDGTSILDTSGPKTVPPLWNSDQPNRQSDTRRVSERSDNEMTSPKTTDEESSENHDEDENKKDENPKIILNVTKKEETKNDTLYSETEINLISTIWGLKLKKVNAEQRRYAEKIINDILFHAEMNYLTTQSVNFFSGI